MKCYKCDGTGVCGSTSPGNTGSMIFKFYKKIKILTRACGFFIAFLTFAYIFLVQTRRKYAVLRAGIRETDRMRDMRIC